MTAKSKKKSNDKGSVLTTKSKKESNKKDSQLIIRINGEQRDKFVSMCEDMDTSAAREIRRFC